MAGHTTITCPAGEWTLLGNMTGALTIIPQDGPVRVKPTTANAAPTDFLGSTRVTPVPGAIIDYTLAQLFPGIAGAYLWAKADALTHVMVSYA